MRESIFTPIGEYFTKTDKIFWLFTIVLSVLGCILIASQQRSDSVDFLKTQIIAVIVGIACAGAGSVIDYHYIGKYWYIAGGLAVILMVLVFFFGMRVNGTDDMGWIRLPFGMTFQPSEFVKICFIVTFSKHLAYLAEKKWLHSFLGVLTLLFHGAIPVVLIHFQGDDGAALVFALMFLVMTFAAGVQIRYFILSAIALIGAVPFFWTSVLNSEQKNRLAVLFRVLKNSANSKNPFGKNICTGFFALISIQVLINLGMVLGILPVIGITLPFMSSGGSSVVCLYIGVGLVQSVHMHPTYEEKLSVKLKTKKHHKVFV